MRFVLQTIKQKNMKKAIFLMTAIAIFGFATISMAQNVRAWGTYYTGTGQEWPNGEERGNSCITDAEANVYMVGFTSSDIATAGAHQTANGNNGYNDAFLVKFNGISLGINENANLFSVYPNPTQSIVNVKADTKLIGSAYSIFDNTGKVVLSGTVNAENTSVELGIYPQVFICLV
jgi:hypothetical protein